MKRARQLIPYLEPKDLIEFGMIPEFVGRLPVVVPIDPLTRDEILRVIVRAARTRWSSSSRAVRARRRELEFTDDALGAVADQALKRETGVRALRSIFEELLLDLRFDLSARKGERTSSPAEFVQERLAGLPSARQPRRKRDSA